LLEKVGEDIGRFGQAVAERGADGLLIPDPVSSSTMISPKLYRSLVLPNLQRCLSSFRLPVILHVCGNTKPILDMMAETGAQMLSLDQCMDLGLAKRQLLGRCGVAGNVDPMTVLRGTVEDVKRASTRCLEQGGKCGYILMAGCAVPGATPIKNLQAMVESARPA
jgi:MtaA/CmuA family methyltransferase